MLLGKEILDDLVNQVAIESTRLFDAQLEGELLHVPYDPEQHVGFVDLANHGVG